MSSDSPGITEALVAAAAGDGDAVRVVFPMIYDELRRLAQAFMDDERSGHTLQATAIVNEAYLRLVNVRDIEWEGRSHFVAAAVGTVRRILIDHARKQRAIKRGGGRSRVELDTSHLFADQSSIDAIDLDDAITALSVLCERQARIVELRLFGGMAIKDIADLLGVSKRTVDGDWSMARSFLRAKLTTAGS